MNTLKTTIIISTYNQPKALEKVLWSYELQTETNFEIIIADDGSSVETKQLIDGFINSSLDIKHVWHEDKGFRKTVILNKAIVASSTDYLIFTDGDCIARKDFVESHLRLRKDRCVLSGGYFKLSECISDAITQSDIIDGNCFNSDWLTNNGLKKSFRNNKLTAYSFKASLLNAFTPTKATFDGMNASGWKQDILDVNGFDERMKYGGEDRELGERLMNNGIRFVQARYSLICVHLYHERPYKNEQDLLINKQIRKQISKSGSVWTKEGIVRNEGSY